MVFTPYALHASPDTAILNRGIPWHFSLNHMLNYDDIYLDRAMEYATQSTEILIFI